MRHETFEMEVTSVGRLFGQVWLPDSKPELVVALIHGLGEHGGRYAHLGHWFADRGIALLTYDQVGHGRSEGKRGHIPSYEGVMKGIETFLSKARSYADQAPIILYGHSLGGNYAVNYAFRHSDQLDGLIVASPWLKLRIQPPYWKRFLSKLFSRIWPGLSQSNGLDNVPLTSDEVRALPVPKENDPLKHDRISVGLFTSAVAAASWALNHAETTKLSYPVLFMHGNGDALTSPEATRELSAKLRGEVQYIEWPDFGHELHNQSEHLQVFQTVYEWIQGVKGQGAHVERS
jgi:alpha-beta hydrolase superfamily lysophospholipase